MIPARQSTAKTIIVGQVLDSTGAIVTDSVVANFEGSVNGGDPAALNGSATLTHRGQGFYSLALTATDLGTVGTFQVTINDGSDACPKETLVVMEEAVYDALFAAAAAGYQVPIWAAANSTVNLSATTVATVTNRVTANTDQLAGQTVTASTGVTFPASIASPTNITAGTLTTVTNLTNLPAITTNWLTTAGIADGAFTAAKFAASSLNGKGDWFLASNAPTNIQLLDISAAGRVNANVTQINGVGATAISLEQIQDATAGVPIKNAAFSYTIKLFLSTDHATAATGKTVTMTRSLDNGAFAAATGTVTEISAGHYRVAASAADMNGDCVTHLFTASGTDDLTIEFPKTVTG